MSIYAAADLKEAKKLVDISLARLLGKLRLKVLQSEKVGIPIPEVESLVDAMLSQQQLICDLKSELMLVGAVTKALASKLSQEEMEAVVVLAVADIKKQNEILEKKIELKMKEDKKPKIIQP